MACSQPAVTDPICLWMYRAKVSDGQHSIFFMGSLGAPVKCRVMVIPDRKIGIPVDVVEYLPLRVSV